MRENGKIWDCQQVIWKSVGLRRWGEIVTAVAHNITKKTVIRHMVHPFQNDGSKSTHPPLVNHLQLPLTTSSVGITLSFCLHTTVYLAIILSWNQSGAFIFLRVQKHYQVYSCISYVYITTQKQMWETRNLRLVHVWAFLYFLYCILLLRQDPPGNWVKINVNFQCTDKINLVPEYFKPYHILFYTFQGL